MFFTITFRSFTPTPGGLEFTPGKDYYLISTSNNRDIHRRVGGWCSSHNMKIVFKEKENPQHIQKSLASFFNPYLEQNHLEKLIMKYELETNMIYENNHY